MTSPRTLLIFSIVIAVLAAGWWVYGRNPAPQGEPPQAGLSPQPPEGPLVDVKLPASLSATAQDGKILFERTCAACHGENAAGTSNGPPLVHKIYEPNHHADQAFALAARNGVRAHHWKFGNMPPQSHVREAEVAAIATYVRELQRENGIF